MCKLTVCRHCGEKTPAENFNCIYCGSPVFEDSGFLGKLRYGKSRIYLTLIAIVVIIAFIIWYFL